VVFVAHGYRYLSVKDIRDQDIVNSSAQQTNTTRSRLREINSCLFCLNFCHYFYILYCIGALNLIGGHDSEHIYITYMTYHP
jgi:hypothetical protein